MVTVHGRGAVRDGDPLTTLPVDSGAVPMQW